ncbi:MAG: M23 family metallopeptidase [Rickettsiales bacterium]
MLFKKRKIVIVSGDRIHTYSLGSMAQSFLLTCGAVVALGVAFAVANVGTSLNAPRSTHAEFALRSVDAVEPAKTTALPSLQSSSEKAALRRVNQLEQELTKTSERLKNMVMLAESLSLAADARPTGKRYGFSKTGIPVPHLREPANRAPLPSQEKSALEKREAALYAGLRRGVDERMRHIGAGLAVLSDKYIPDPKLRAARQGEASGQGGPYVPENLSAASEAFEISSDLVSLATVRDRLSAMPLGRPLANYRVTGPFGSRVDPINGRRAVHYGLDVSAGYGSKVYATAGGRVLRAGVLGAYGNLVEITHPNFYSTRYGHLARVLVKPGQRVRQGQLIGLQGNTGRSTGTHLHYEVRYRNVAVNPYNFLKAGQYVF